MVGGKCQTREPLTPSLSRLLEQNPPVEGMISIKVQKGVRRVRFLRRMLNDAHWHFQYEDIFDLRSLFAEAEAARPVSLVGERIFARVEVWRRPVWRLNWYEWCRFLSSFLNKIPESFLR